jgi:hypothetical protein
VDRVIGVAALFTGVEQGKVGLGQLSTGCNSLDQIGIGNEGPAKADRICFASISTVRALSALRLLLVMIGPLKFSRNSASVSRSGRPMSTTWR